MEREEHVMIQTRSLRGLAVALFMACAAMAAIPQPKPIRRARKAT